MKDGKGKWGYTEGNMAPHVESCQKPEKDYAERGFSKTTDYIGRKNKQEGKEASQIKKQHYQGRYS